MATYEDCNTFATQFGNTQFDNTPDAGMTPPPPPPVDPIAPEAKKAGWKAVAVGGASGILIGGGAMLATSLGAGATTPEATPAPETPSAETPETSAEEAAATAGAATPPEVAEVSGGLSFSEAFNEARAEVGPGGVFTWHGGVYSTYTAEEWNSMSAEERDTYVHSISPDVYAEAAHDHSASHAHAQHVEVEDSNVHQVIDTPEEPGNSDSDDGVRFLGLSAVGENEDGSTNYAGIATVEGHAAILANTDGDADNTFDQMWVDINDNENVDDGEVTDISEMELTAADFASLAESPVPETTVEVSEPTVSEEYSAQSDIAVDMPDYIDDADVNLV